MKKYANRRKQKGKKVNAYMRREKKKRRNRVSRLYLYFIKSQGNM